MSCNIRIPIQQIIDDVAAALSGRYISTDNPFLNEAVLTDTTFRGDLIMDTAAREALCYIIESCSITANELEWLGRPTAAQTVAVSGATGVTWKNISTLISWGDIQGDISDQEDLSGIEISSEKVITSSGQTQEDVNAAQQSFVTDQGLLNSVMTSFTESQISRNMELPTIYDFGAIADGTLHTLLEWITPGSEHFRGYSDLASIQVDYPHATALTDSVDSIAIQQAIDKSAAKVIGSVVILDGRPVQDREIVLRSGVTLAGTGYNTAVVTKKAGYNGRALVTEGFDTFTGTTNNNMPYGFAITGVMFDGQFMESDWMSATNSYVNTSGGGIYIYGRDYKLDVDVRYQAGVGVWLEGKVDGTTFNDRYDLDLKLRIFVCKEECLIFKGGADIVMEQVFCAFGGAVHKQDDASLPRVSPTYGLTNGGRTDNMVFDTGCEIGTIHSWAAQSGYGIKLSAGRFNADLLISESVRMGAFDIGSSVYGMIDRMDAHSCYGNMDGSTPDILIAASNGAGLHIGKIRNQRNGYASSNAQTSLDIRGAFTNIAHFHHDGLGNGGHVVKISGSYNSIAGGMIHNVVGNAADGVPSAGYWRSGIGNNSFKAKIINLPVTFWSDGAPKAEEVTINYVNTTTAATSSIVKGDPRNYNRAQVWRIHGVNGDKYAGTDSTLTVPFDSSVATEQTLTTDHGLVTYSNIANFQVTTSGVGPVAVQYCYVSAVSGSTVTIKVKMLEATATNLAPQVNIRAVA